MTSDELLKIENIVSRVITDKKTVYTSIVPLKSAQGITGLRAVFGEQYPDPVRVVSVGTPIPELLQSSTNSVSNTKSVSGIGSGFGFDASVEFCGGTHLENTEDAQAFVITEETAVARGIRRISAVTGSNAVDAISNYNNWMKDMKVVSSMATKADSNTGNIIL